MGRHAVDHAESSLVRRRIGLSPLARTLLSKKTASGLRRHRARLRHPRRQNEKTSGILGQTYVV